MPPWCETILDLKVDLVQGKQVTLEWTETSGGLWKWWQDPGVPLAFPVVAPPLEMRGERREFFPDNAGKVSFLSSYEAETGSSGCGQDSRASSRVERGISGNFLSAARV